MDFDEWRRLEEDKGKSECECGKQFIRLMSVVVAALQLTLIFFHFFGVHVGT